MKRIQIYYLMQILLRVISHFVFITLSDVGVGAH